MAHKQDIHKQDIEKTIEALEERQISCHVLEEGVVADEDIYVRGQTTIRAGALTAIQGGIYIYGDALLSAPALAYVQGGIFIHKGGRLEAPGLARNDVLGGIYVEGSIWRENWMENLNKKRKKRTK